MVSRTKINLLLFAVAGLLGLLVWLSQPAPLPPLTHLDPQQITRIRINDLQGREISLMWRQNQWMSSDQPADQSRVRQLLKICRTPSLSRFTAPDDLEPYGLAPSPIVMALDDTTLSFGNSDPVYGWRYVHHQGEVHLIADGFYHHLIAPPEAWLAKTTN
ncbi:MAG: DUF4340 domain-containing protein [Candidatus Thiodiazotropha sp. (ex Cardiolucina cf. quadrata)]|nr:DUF4340 domain-containing protein [Candidatus Thiodiazotropha sp. (ex Cardiolucina cf. quadrata)]